jgi:hypothetical protein
MQTAVEWLVNELKKSIHYQRVINEVNQSSSQNKDVIDEAKQMEKQEIESAYEEGYNRAAKVIEDEIQRVLKDNI